MPTKRQCKRALEVHEDELSGLDDVVGLGVIRLDAMKTGTENNAVAVYVRAESRAKRGGAKAKAPKTKSSDSRSIGKQPATRKIPKFLMIEGRGKSQIKVPVKIIEQGEVELEFRGQKKSMGTKPLGKQPSGNEPLGKEPL